MALEQETIWNCDLKVADVYITDELHRRAPQKTDYLSEKEALLELAGKMANDPEQMLPRFVDLAMRITGGVSAGISLYESNPAPGVFRWRYLRGVLAQFENATTPRDFSPCGITLDRNGPVLTLHPERVYDWISDANIVVPEVLLVPLYIGGSAPLGTLWIVSDEVGHFDSGHARALTELGTFVGIALRMLKTERDLKAALEHQETLTSEMSHRVKNLFAVTAGIVRVSARSASSPSDMSDVLLGRLTALSEANGLVRRTFSDNAPIERADLAELAGKIMLPHAAANHGKTFTAIGPSVALDERATTGLALVLHELATNAVKYGAFQGDKGSVALTWQIENDRLAIDWTELGGPVITQAPAGTGFGTRLSRSTIVDQFRGELTHDWRAQGLAVRMSIPLSSLAQ